MLMFVCLSAPRSLQVLSARPVNPAGTVLPPAIIIASTTIQVLDDDGQPSSVVGITPTVQSSSSTCTGSCSEYSSRIYYDSLVKFHPIGPLTSIQLVACDVQAQNTTIKIDASEGELTDPVGLLSALWNDWTLPSPPSSTQSFLDPVGA